MNHSNQYPFCVSAMDIMLWLSPVASK